MHFHTTAHYSSSHTPNRQSEKQESSVLSAFPLPSPFCFFPCSPLISLFSQILSHPSLLSSFPFFWCSAVVIQAHTAGSGASWLLPDPTWKALWWDPGVKGIWRGMGESCRWVLHVALLLKPKSTCRAFHHSHHPSTFTSPLFQSWGSTLHSYHCAPQPRFPEQPHVGSFQLYAVLSPSALFLCTSPPHSQCL